MWGNQVQEDLAEAVQDELELQEKTSGTLDGFVPAPDLATEVLPGNATGVVFRNLPDYDIASGSTAGSRPASPLLSSPGGHHGTGRTLGSHRTPFPSEAAEVEPSALQGGYQAGTIVRDSLQDSLRYSSDFSRASEDLLISSRVSQENGVYCNGTAVSLPDATKRLPNLSRMLPDQEPALLDSVEPSEPRHAEPNQATDGTGEGEVQFGGPATDSGHLGPSSTKPRLYRNPARSAHGPSVPRGASGGLFLRKP